MALATLLALAMEKGPCVQSLELRWVDSSHTSAWGLMLRGRFVSLEKGEFTRHPVTVEGYVCRSEEHRSPLYLFLGVGGSRLIK